MSEISENMHQNVCARSLNECLKEQIDPALLENKNSCIIGLTKKLYIFIGVNFNIALLTYLCEEKST